MWSSFRVEGKATHPDLSTNTRREKAGFEAWHPEGREGEVFLGQEEDCLVVPTRCTGSTWAVWNLGCLPVGSSSPFVHVAHPVTSAEWKHLTSDITVAQGNRHLHLKLYWEEREPPNCKTHVEGKERCKCYIHRCVPRDGLGEEGKAASPRSGL